MTTLMLEEKFATYRGGQQGGNKVGSMLHKMLAMTLVANAGRARATNEIGDWGKLASDCQH